MASLVHSAVRRGGWGLSSQIANTGSNLLLAVMVARVASPESFGAWSLAYIAYVVALSLNRSVASTPMLLDREPHGELPPADIRGSGSASILIGVVAGLILLVIGLLLPVLGPPAIAFAVVMPALLLQDLFRYVCFRREQPKRAAILDLVWLVAQVSGFTTISALGRESPVTLTLVWGFAASISAALAWKALGGSLSAPYGVDFLKRHRSTSMRLLVDSLIVTTTTHSLPILLAATSGLAAAGALRAGLTVMGGIGILVMGLGPILTVEAMKAQRLGESDFRIVVRWSVLLAVLGASYGVAVLVLPDDVGHALLGDSWQSAAPLLFPLALQGVLRGPLTAAPLVLRARMQLNRALKLRVVTSIPVIVLPALGALRAGAQGAAWGLVVSTVLVDILAMLALRRGASSIRDDTHERGSGGGAAKQGPPHQESASR